MSYIAVIDYDVGNIKSILNALSYVGVSARLTRDRQEIMSSAGVILPGVGAFKHGMSKLSEHCLISILHEYSDSDKPILGICLGMQMLFESSEEFGITDGVGLIPGRVVELQVQDDSVEKLPHVSWNELAEPCDARWVGTVLEGIKPKSDMYFVHSFIAQPANNENILSRTSYAGNEFCSSVQYRNIYGCQFHPEKSANEGLKIINNFVKICKV